MADEIEQLVLAALSPVLENTWSATLPDQPTFPAIMFEVETETEPGWAANCGYDRHFVQVNILAPTKAEVKALFAQVDAAMMDVSGFLAEGERGDADYEDDPNMYAYFADYIVRLPRHETE